MDFIIFYFIMVLALIVLSNLLILFKLSMDRKVSGVHEMLSACFEELLVKTIHEDGNVNSVESNLNLNNTEYEFK